MLLSRLSCMQPNMENYQFLLSVGIVHHMAANKFQLCCSHVILKMTYKCCLDIFLLVNESAAGSKQTRIYDFGQL